MSRQKMGTVSTDSDCGGRAGHGSVPNDTGSTYGMLMPDGGAGGAYASGGGGGGSYESMTQHANRVLCAALLWLRNHYELSPNIDDDLREEVLSRVDRILDKYGTPGIADMKELSRLFPRKK